MLGNTIEKNKGEDLKEVKIYKCYCCGHEVNVNMPIPNPIAGCSCVGGLSHEHYHDCQAKYAPDFYCPRIIYLLEEVGIPMVLGAMIWEYANNPFTSTWIVGGDFPMSVLLPLSPAGTYDFEVIWGDGKRDHINAYNQKEVKHEYATPGQKTIRISGIINGFTFNQQRFTYFGFPQLRDQLTNISQWGDLRLEPRKGCQFMHCTNLQVTAIDSPNLTQVTNMMGMFMGALRLDCDLSSWDTSTATNMRAMFLDAELMYPRMRNFSAVWSMKNVTDNYNKFDEPQTGHGV